MTRGIKTEASLHAEARRLRIEDRLSLREIADQTGIPKGSLSPILADIPLTESEKAERAARPRRGSGRDLSNQPFGRSKSIFYETMRARALTSDQKGAVAEAAAIFRLTVWGLTPNLPLTSNGRADVLATVPTRSRIARIQVKLAQYGVSGRPFVGAHSHNRKGKDPYSAADVDFIVAYDALHDLCYVWPISAFAKSSYKTCRSEYAERWDLVATFLEGAEGAPLNEKNGLRQQPPFLIDRPVAANQS